MPPSGIATKTLEKRERESSYGETKELTGVGPETVAAKTSGVKGPIILRDEKEPEVGGATSYDGKIV